MGSSCSMQKDEQSKRNALINRDIKRQEDKELGNQKLLLLGTGECGKSTILKQITILHDQEQFNSQYLTRMAPVVYSSVIMGMASLIRARDRTMLYKWSKPEMEIHAAHITSLSDSSSGKEKMPFLDLTYNSLKALWDEPCMQKTFLLREEFNIADNLEYFMEELDRINDPKFVPNFTDILRLRIPTTGVTECAIHIKDVLFRVFDVGGQRSERRKWIHVFDNVNAIIFITALNEFDTILSEDNDTNRMVESLSLFGNIAHSRWFLKTSIILFLNKKDLFEEKLKTKNINYLFKDYKGSNDFHESLAFIREEFEQRSLNLETRRLYAHVTCATDTDQVQKVIDSVVDIVIGKNLRGTGME